jgi:tetratricopeptide (TPR) repeat protein
MSQDEAMRRAAALFGAGHGAEARALCDSILAADARHFYALHLAAAIALREGDFEACVSLATRALDIDPEHVEVLCNRGAALRRLNRIEAALSDYDRALAADPRSAVALNNRGVALAALNLHDDAIRSYTRALEASPGYANARFHRALSRLVAGDLAGGWEDHEARWGGAETQGRPREFSRPAWTGAQSVQGKTVLLYAEQGLGDTIQFSRYAKLVRGRGAAVVLETQAPLKDLLETLPDVDTVVATGDPLPPFDYHCALLSAPRSFATTLATLPASVPYLSAPAGHVDRWRARLDGRAAPRVGLAWSGSTTLVNDRNRSIPLARLAPLLAQAGSFVSLQKEIRASDAAALQAFPSLVHFGGELADFRDTAALVARMDVVITVDTAVAHLAGAMGKAVWILLPFSPDWRWLLGRDDSPWYPTARLFRQARSGDWDPVIERAATAIARWPSCDSRLP